MAITATFALQNVPINADTVRQAIASLTPDGPGGLVSSTDFAVTQTGTPSMGVSVGVGRAWIEGTDSAHLTGQAYGKQGKYFVLNDAAVTVAIATADATNPRIDVIYVAVQDAMYAGANNQAVIAVAKGTATAGATYPTNAPSLPTNSVALAWINVPANATSITNTNITAIVGITVGAAQTGNTKWIAPTVFGNGFNPYTGSGYDGVKYRLVNGHLHVSGAAINTGTWANGVAICAIPSPYIPTRKIVGSNCVVDTTGNVLTTTTGTNTTTTFFAEYPLG